MDIGKELTKLINSKKPILKKKLVDLIEDRLDEAFNDGHAEGYDEGAIDAEQYNELD